MPIKTKKRRGFEKKKSLYGLLFCVPWVIGMLAFFVIPLLKSIWYSFCEVGFADTGGIKTQFIGLENINFVLKQDPYFATNLGDSISSFAFSFPIIIVLSLLFAVLLNQKFKGRIFIRGIFFLPVIIATGVVMQNLTSSVSGQPAMQEIGSAGGYAVSAIDFSDVLSNLNIPQSMITLISDYVAKVFNIVWKTGIQTVLFVSGMQTIPDQQYEVSKIEGASKWEEFWFVTIPSLKNIILLVMMFTMVDLFVTVESPVVNQAFELVKSMSYGLSSAALWIYMFIAMAISAVVLIAYQKCCLKRWDERR